MSKVKETQEIKDPKIKKWAEELQKKLDKGKNIYSKVFFLSRPINMGGSFRCDGGKSQ